MLKKFLIALAFTTCTALIGQEALNNDSVVKMTKAGLSDDVIVSTLNSTAGKYDVSPDGLIALKTAGVSDKVLAAVVAKAAQAKQDADNAASQNQQDSQVDSGVAKGTKPISSGARVVIAPMGGFETYFAAAIREKKVPISLTLDKASAQYFVVSTNTEWQGFVFGSGGSANWTKAGGSASYGSAGSTTRGLEASIMLIDAKTKDVIWAYEVHKNSHGSLLFGTFGARGQQSIAEACAKHLKEYIEKGK